MKDILKIRWLSVDEICQYLGVKKDSIYMWIEHNRLPAHKVGRCWKFKIKDIDQWILDGHSDLNKIENRRPKKAEYQEVR